MNPYTVLNIRSDASPAEVKRAYRALARELHPDVGGSELEFKRLTAARDLLLDPLARRRFDETWAHPSSGPDIDGDGRASGYASTTEPAADPSTAPGADRHRRGSRFSYSPPRRTGSWFADRAPATQRRRSPYSVVFMSPSPLDRRAWGVVAFTSGVFTMLAVSLGSLGSGVVAPAFAFAVLAMLAVFAQQIPAPRPLRDLASLLVCALPAFAWVQEDQVLFLSLVLLLVSHRPKLVTVSLPS